MDFQRSSDVGRLCLDSYRTLVEFSGVYFRKVVAYPQPELLWFASVITLRGSADLPRIIPPTWEWRFTKSVTPFPGLLIHQLMCYTLHWSGSAGPSCVIPVRGSSGSLRVIPPTLECWFTKSVTPYPGLLIHQLTCYTLYWSGSAGSSCVIPVRGSSGSLRVMPPTWEC